MPSDRIPSWDEWSSQLTEEQRKYSLYKILEAIDKKLTERVISCEERFERLEKRKSWNSTESLMGGIWHRRNFGSYRQLGVLERRAMT